MAQSLEFFREYPGRTLYGWGWRLQHFLGLHGGVLARDLDTGLWGPRIHPLLVIAVLGMLVVRLTRAPYLSLGILTAGLFALYAGLHSLFSYTGFRYVTGSVSTLVAEGLSQTELGTQLGISFQQIQKYEKGMNRVSGGRLYRIARILGVKITYFFDGVDHLLDSDAVPSGRNEVGTLDITTMRAAHTLANLPDEDIKKKMLRLIAALPGRKAAR